MNLLPPPGPARRKQLTVLVLALAALAAVGWYQLGPAGSASPAAAPSTASNPRAVTATAPNGKPAAAPGMPEPLELAALEPVPAEPSAGRNPFRFGVPPPPPRPPAPPPAPYVPPPPTPPPGPPPVPRIPLKYNGMMILVMPETGEQRKFAVLSDGQGGQFKASEGEIVDGRYRLVKIGQDSVLIEWADGTGRMAIQVGG